MLFLNLLLEDLSNKTDIVITELENLLLQPKDMPIPIKLVDHEIFIQMRLKLETTILFNNILFIFKQKQIGELKQFSILEFCKLIRFIAKPFMTIQRYKGLGEMNAEQLWETAMDPENRQLKQLSITDFLETEGWLILLMGEEVAPRKNFIEQKAHFAKNLDF